MINAGNDFVDSDDEELGAKVTVHQSAYYPSDLTR